MSKIGNSENYAKKLNKPNAQNMNCNGIKEELQKSSIKQNRY